MKKKHIVLSLLFVSMAFTQNLICAQDKNVMIKKAQEAYRTFVKDLKKDIKDLWSKEPITREQKVRLIKQGAALTTIILLLTGAGIGTAVWLRRRGKDDHVALPDSPAAAEEEESSSEPPDLPESPETTAEEGLTPEFAQELETVSQMDFEDIKSEMKRLQKVLQQFPEEKQAELQTLLNQFDPANDTEQARQAYAKFLVLLHKTASEPEQSTKVLKKVQAKKKTTQIKPMQAKVGIKGEKKVRKPKQKELPIAEDVKKQAEKAFELRKAEWEAQRTYLARQVELLRFPKLKKGRSDL